MIDDNAKFVNALLHHSHGSSTVRPQQPLSVSRSHTRRNAPQCNLLRELLPDNLSVAVGPEVVGRGVCARNIIAISTNKETFTETFRNLPKLVSSRSFSHASGMRRVVNGRWSRVVVLGSMRGGATDATEMAVLAMDALTSDPAVESIADDGSLLINPVVVVGRTLEQIRGLEEVTMGSVGGLSTEKATVVHRRGGSRVKTSGSRLRRARTIQKGWSQTVGTRPVPTRCDSGSHRARTENPPAQGNILSVLPPSWELITKVPLGNHHRKGLPDGLSHAQRLSRTRSTLLGGDEQYDCSIRYAMLRPLLVEHRQNQRWGWCAADTWGQAVQRPGDETGSDADYVNGSRSVPDVESGPCGANANEYGACEEKLTVNDGGSCGCDGQNGSGDCGSGNGDCKTDGIGKHATKNDGGTERGHEVQAGTSVELHPTRELGDRQPEHGSYDARGERVICVHDGARASVTCVRGVRYGRDETGSGKENDSAPCDCNGMRPTGSAPADDWREVRHLENENGSDSAQSSQHVVYDPGTVHEQTTLDENQTDSANGTAYMHKHLPVSPPPAGELEVASTGERGDCTSSPVPDGNMSGSSLSKFARRTTYRGFFAVWDTAEVPTESLLVLEETLGGTGESLSTPSVDNPIVSSREGVPEGSGDGADEPEGEAEEGG
ncbi:hypothetical protein C8R42DRAFT_648515 [Lentinula raphanica]|nr:hypothetical protein C8R42DRAFT_648515 [Lentinula raphanica]